MYNRVLVPLDGSKLAECVLPHVEALAKGCQAAVVEFVQVYAPFQIPPSIEPVPLKQAEIDAGNRGGIRQLIQTQEPFHHGIVLVVR